MPYDDCIISDAFKGFNGVIQGLPFFHAASLSTEILNTGSQLMLSTRKGKMRPGAWLKKKISNQRLTRKLPI